MLASIFIFPFVYILFPKFRSKISVNGTARKVRSLGFLKMFYIFFVRYENQDPGINKRPPSDEGRFSVKIIGAPTHDS